ncbi:hypothetical protein BGZ54_009130 [Gamsiella multidivaricata]|nr:hypothetical protein BGZ54_009130 [Gamsiella multidivaricata]
MYLQQHHQQAQQQWLLEQQQNQQQLLMQHQNLAQDSSFNRQSNRKRGLANESDEFMGIKKRNLGSEASAQGIFGYPETGPGTPGFSTDQVASGPQHCQQAGYFDQPFHTASGASPYARSFSQSPSAGFGSGNGGSAPTTPGAAGDHGPSTVPGVSNMPSHSWGSFAQGSSSFSSPPTPHFASMPGSSSPGVAATGIATSIFASTLAEKNEEPLEYRLLQEQKKLHEAQQQEQAKLQLAQQLELQEMQRHQVEHTHAATLAEAAGQTPSGYIPTPVHHDHNDPATWGYDGTVPSGGQLQGYLAGHGKGYTPAAIGGVAALAAMAAASRENYVAGRGRGSGGMDMEM